MRPLNRQAFPVGERGIALRRWIPYVLCAAACVLSLEAASYVSSTGEARRAAQFHVDADDIRQQIAVRLNTYIEVVRAGTALLAASNEIHHSEFRAFVRRLELPTRYPGLEGVGFAQRVPLRGLPDFVRNARLDGITPLDVHPRGTRLEYNPVVFVEPMGGERARAIGFDLSTDPIHRAAMNRARDTGQPALSSRLASGLPFDGSSPDRVMLYVPVYRSGAPKATVADRRRALHGFVFSPLQPGLLLQHIAAATESPVTFDVRDGPSAASMIHSSAAAAVSPAYRSTGLLQVGGRDWIVVVASADEAAGLFPDDARNTLLAGLLLSVMLFVITRVQIEAWETAARHSAELRASEQALRASDAQLRELVVREREARAAAQAADRAKDDFLAGLSHELRTPLNAVLGWLTLLKSGSVREDRRAHALQVIERNARVQAQLVEDLLDVSRILLGKMTVALEPLSLRMLVASVLESLRPAADAAGVELREPIAQGDTIVEGDSARLHQVVWNLVSNAIKFTPSGGRVDVEIADDGDTVELRVRDNGIGITAELLPHIFERFRQADSTSDRARAGLGLGLAITRHLVELHRGTVEAFSDGAQRGATFVVRFPSAALVADRTGETVLAPSPALNRVRVLVVDDDADSRDMLAEAIAATGADVVSASSASDALLHLNRGGADVLVSDIRMPDVDGLALLRRIRALPGSAGRIPAIAVTAYAREHDRAEAFEAGYEIHLAKPVELAELREGVARLATRASDSRL